MLGIRCGYHHFEVHVDGIWMMGKADGCNVDELWLRYGCDAHETVRVCFSRTGCGCVLPILAYLRR